MNESKIPPLQTSEERTNPDRPTSDMGPALGAIAGGAAAGAVAGAVGGPITAIAGAALGAVAGGLTVETVEEVAEAGDRHNAR